MENNTLFVTVPKGDLNKTFRVVVMEQNSPWCKIFYQDAWDGETIESLLRDIRDMIAESEDAALPF